MVSDDLMFESRLRSALGEGGPAVSALSGEEVPDAGLVFVDLNSRVPLRLDLIGRLRRANPDAIIVGFCHHAADEVRIAAMRSGATRVVTNGAVPAVARRLLQGG